MPSRFASRVPSLRALALYVVTLAMEVPVILARMLVIFVTSTLVLLLTGHSTGDAWTFAELCILPTLWAVFALFTPFGGGWWWKQNLGGREPSQREQLAYADAVELLQAHTDTPLPLPKRWFVIDTPQPDAAVCGDALMLSRGLLETDHVPAVLAHELGHLATPDGKLTAALNRLVIHPPPTTPEEDQQDQQQTSGATVIASDRVILTILGIRALLWIVRNTIRLAKGGLGLWLTANIWASYWRTREYHADQYAAGLGQADELADFLEIHALIHDQPVPFIWLTEHTHPPTELRIDKLRNSTLSEQTPAQDTPAQAPSDTRPLTA
jgi:Zn-dependent protease with chaperone function